MTKSLLSCTELDCREIRLSANVTILGTQVCSYQLQYGDPDALDACSLVWPQG